MLVRATKQQGTIPEVAPPDLAREPATGDRQEIRTIRLARPADRAPLDGPRSGPRPTDPDTSDRHVLRLEGEYWTIVYAGLILRLRDAVGLRHLAQLVWHPQREFHALDLMRALALSGRSRAGRPPCADTPEVDARAASEYRRRLDELQEELAEAEGRDDLGRTDSVRHEIDTIIHELRHGVHGRRMKVDAERARTAVTKAIKITLGRIRSFNPALGGHLDASVKRGYVCVYRPDPRFPIRWDW